MDTKLIQQLFDRFESIKFIVRDVECWRARELQPMLGYIQWRNFLDVIDKAKESCKNSGEEISDHFADDSKMVDLGSEAQREVDDIILTRYACYLVAMNGKTSKNEIAFAQTYSL